MRIRAFCFRALELRDHVLVMEDRSRDQMRKVRDEQRVMRQRVARDVAPVGVDQKRDLRESVEGNADRQQDVRVIPVENIALRLAARKPAYLKMPSTSKIAGDADREHRKARRGAQFPGDQQIADAVIERDRTGQQRHELPVAEGVEGERGQRQPDHRGEIAEPAQREIAKQNDRQEQENEGVGIEEHQAFLSRSEKPNHTPRSPTTPRLRRRAGLLEIVAIDPI